MSENLPVTDADIADFRETHSDALYSQAHPLHAQRLSEMSAMFDRRFAAPAEIAAPAGSAAEHREKHEAALLDRSHADHATRTAELTALHERDAVEPGDSMASVSDPSEYDFSRFKATVQAPTGEELVQDPELEASARQWMAEGGLSAVEGEAMASLYGESLRWSDEEHGRIAATTQAGMEKQFGDRVQEAASAALQVAHESGAYEFLNESGLINHWQVINTLITKAEAKGYFKRTAQ